MRVSLAIMCMRKHSCKHVHIATTRGWEFRKSFRARSFVQTERFYFGIVGGLVGMGGVGLGPSQFHRWGARGQGLPTKEPGIMSTVIHIDLLDKELTRSSTLPDTHDARGPRHPKQN